MTECDLHPRLETIQYLDFTVPRALPWESLVERIQEVEITERQSATEEPPGVVSAAENVKSTYVNQILAYLDQRGFQMVSFDRIREKVNRSLTNDQLEGLIKANPATFRSAKIKGGKPGLAKLVP